MDRPKVKVERRGLGNSFRMPRDAEGHIIRPVADAGADSYDRTDKLAGHTDTMSSGPPPYSSMDRGDKHNRRPGETEPDRGDMTEDRRDKMLGNHDKTEGAPGEGGDAALLEEGGALHGAKKSKEDKEREKREKEEEKRRQKEAEKEKKRLEKEKKKNKDNTEDRVDRLGGEDATETAINGTSGTMGLDSQGGFGLDGSHPDYSDKSIDRKMQFIAVTPPSTEVRDRQRGDNTMPFFESVGSTSDGEGEGTLGKKKPPPVAPKKYRDSQDDRLGDMYKTERDGKTETRVEKKVVISQEENGDDIDHDALLAEAIKSVTEMNPDLSVERIECMRQIEDVDGGREVLG